ncbi:MAG: 1-acyl-sn-glycerol-3-phosphate acyltransferase [Anaerolineae bacterium]
MKSYSLPLPLVAALTVDIARNRPRSLLQDSRDLLASLTPPPCIEGVEHIPASGGCAIIYNHYERPGLWIGFAGAMLITAVAQRQGDRAVPLHMLVIDRALIQLARHEVELPFSRFFLKRVAHIWGMLPLSAAAQDTARRAASLKQALSLVRQRRPIAIAPEGAIRGDRGLQAAVPGTGAFLQLLSRRGAPLVPAGIWEEGDRLYARLGEPFGLTSADDASTRAEVMGRIAALLPQRMRGGN